MGININSLVVAGRMQSDPEKKEFNNGGCLVQFQIGFLESNWFDAKEKKWKYKNGFLTVKKSFNDKGKPDYLMELAKGMDVVITGKLGYEEWEDKGSGKKRNRVVMVADKVQGVKAGSEPRQQSNNNVSRSSESDDDFDGPSGGEDIPF